MALEVDHLHLLLDPGVGMMETFVVEGLDLLGGEVDGDHRGDRVGERRLCPDA